MTPSNVQQSVLRIAPAVALLALVGAGGAYALANHQPKFSSLDGAARATISRPAPSTVFDKSWMAQFDTFMDERLPRRDRMLEAHAAVATKIFRDPVLNDVYLEGPFGQLLERPPVLDIRDSLATEAEALAQVAPDVPTLFVYAPRKEELYDDALPEAWPTDYPQAHSVITEAWSGAGELVDLTDSMQARADSGNAYFMTDHHWNPTTAKAAAADVAARLGELGVAIGTDSREYVDQTAALPFFGSTGRVVTSGATAPDTFTFPVPEGGFAATMCIEGECGLPTIDMDRVNAPGKYVNRYAAFIGGDNGLVTITNDSPTAKGTVLLLKDSLGNAFATYLAERVATLVVIDERHYTGVPLNELAAQLRPDAVIALHNPLSLLSDSFEPGVWLMRGDVATVEPKVVGNVAIVTEQGLMLGMGPNQRFDASLAGDAKALVDAIDATGVPQVWFIAPRKEVVFADLMPADAPNPVVANSAAVVDALASVAPLEDLTPVLSDPDRRHDYYFRTDHHWAVDGGRVAAEHIVASLAQAGVSLGEDNREWSRSVGPLPFYGSEALALPVDEPVIPDDLVYETPAGGFRATLCFVADDCGLSPINADYLTAEEWETNRYRAFLGGTSGLMHLHNDDPSARGTLVVLSDSYGASPTVRLAERARDVYFIDERKYTGGPLGQFITDVDADAVVVLHNPVTLLSRAFDRDVWRDAGD